MPIICQNMKLSDVNNPHITSSGAREIEVNTRGGNNELISVTKEFHDFILAYNVAMRGGMEGDNNHCTSHFFRNTKGRCFRYGIGKAITRFREKYMQLGLHKNECNSENSKVNDHHETPLGLKPGVAGSDAANQKKTQTRLVDDFVCNDLSEKYPFMNELPTVKQIGIQMTKSNTSAKDYELWRVLALDSSFPKKIKDRWEYCNQEAIAEKALEMYKERPSDEDITKVREEYNLYKLDPHKIAGLWKPPVIRMKRPSSKSYLHRNRATEKEMCEGESTQNQQLLSHIENQDWPNLIIGEVAGRGRVVRATQIIERGKYVCNFDGVVLEPEACKTFF